MVGVPGRSGGHNIKPTAKHKVDGGYRTDRHGNRVDAIHTPPGAPEPPKGLTKAQLEFWTQIVLAMPPDALGRIDSYTLHELLELWAIAVKARKSWKRDPSDKESRIAYTSAIDRVFKIGAEYGMTPASRARLRVPVADDEDDPFQELIDRLSHN